MKSLQWTLRIKNKSADISRPTTHHLYLSMRHFDCPLGEETEVYFSLYDMNQSRYIRYLYYSHLNNSSLNLCVCF